MVIGVILMHQFQIAVTLLVVYYFLQQKDISKKAFLIPPCKHLTVLVLVQSIKNPNPLLEFLLHK